MRFFYGWGIMYRYHPPPTSQIGNPIRSEHRVYEAGDGGGGGWLVCWGAVGVPLVVRCHVMVSFYTRVGEGLCSYEEAKGKLLSMNSLFNIIYII